MMTTTTSTSPARPTSDVDIYSDENILSPYETYRALRDQAPAIWLDQYGVWALSRYRDVYGALHDHETFSSAQGIALCDEVNQMLIGNSVATDPPEHDRIRAITAPQMSNRALRNYQEMFAREAAALVDELCERGTFDAVTDFAERFPSSLVPDLLGWPQDGRAHLYDWASAVFNAIGPMNERTIAGLPALQEMGEFTHKVATTDGALTEGSWGAELVAKARAGEISDQLLPSLIIDYLAPSLDTTKSALGSVLLLLGSHPDQWKQVRDDRALIPSAFNEVLRYEAPIRGFYRVVTKDVTYDGATIPADSRVLVLYASANRDERFWENADTFDVTRKNAAGHMGFGHGVHSCLGMGLARMEANALLTALADRVEAIEVGEPIWSLNNTIRGLESLEVTVRH
jgi:cytochrome P450